MSKRLKRLLLLVALVLLVLLSLKMFRIIRSSVWDGAHHINIAIDNGDLEVWSIEPKEKSVNLVIIPKNMYLSAGSYGNYRAEAIGKLSLLEKKDGTLLKEAVLQTLAVPITASSVRKEADSVLDGRSLFGIGGLFNAVIGRKLANRVSDLSFFDLIRLWLFSLNLRSETVNLVNLSQSSVSSSIDLPDQTVGFIVDKERFSPLAKKYFLDSGIADENLSVEIVNGTSQEGTANNLATLLTNIGGKVVNTAKARDLSDESIVFAKQKSYTAELIARQIRGKIVSQMPKESRADIYVLIGEEK